MNKGKKGNATTILLAVVVTSGAISISILIFVLSPLFFDLNCLLQLPVVISLEVVFLLFLGAIQIISLFEDANFQVQVCYMEVSQS